MSKIEDKVDVRGDGRVIARVIETASRIRIHLASACPNASLFRLIAGRLAAAGP